MFGVFWGVFGVFWGVFWSVFVKGLGSLGFGGLWGFEGL